MLSLYFFHFIDIEKGRSIKLTLFYLGKICIINYQNKKTYSRIKEVKELNELRMTSKGRTRKRPGKSTP